MNRFPFFRVVLAGLPFLSTALIGAEPAAAKPREGSSRRSGAQRWEYPAEQKPVPQIRIDRVPLPPLPEGVEELKFPDFFKLPVGALGLEVTDRLRALDGKNVRILGFQVREQIGNCDDCAQSPRPGARPRPAWMNHLVPGRLLLSPSPSTINMAHYGLSDDLPPQTLYVTVPNFFGEPVPFTPGLLLLTGTLSVGNKTEADGRISVVRLTVDAPAQAAEPTLSSADSAANATTTPTKTNP